MSEYKPKQFTKEISEQMKLDMNTPFDEQLRSCSRLIAGRLLDGTKNVRKII